MCYSSNPTSHNQEGTANSGHLYPDLRQFTAGNQAGQQPVNLMEPPIMQLLRALGLVPEDTTAQPHPHQPTPDATAAPSAPPADDTTPPTSSNAGQGKPQHEELHQQHNPPPQPQPQPQASASVGGCPHSDCPHQAGQPQPQGPFWWGQPQQQQQTNPSWWWTNNSNNPWQQFNTCPRWQSTCQPNFARFMANLGQTLKQVFVTSGRVTAFVTVLTLIHLLAPSALLQNIVFMVLATGMGLHLPTLVAGQLLWAAVSCLRVFEPLFLTGLLVFAVHKMVVRREALFDQAFWRNRFGSLRVVINDNFNQN